MKRIFIATLVLFACISLSAKQITVMSYNMRYGEAKDGANSWENRKPATPAMLNDCAPDVFGVQECLPFQAEWILSQCPQYDGYGLGRNDGVKGERTEIFWKKDIFEVVDKGTFWLSTTPDVPSKGWDATHTRTATWVLLKYKKGGKCFYFVNTHLDHRGRVAMKEGLNLIYKWICEHNTAKLPVVLTGDFNMADNDAIILDFNGKMNNSRITTKKLINDVSTYHGYKDSKSRYVIDYIYYDNFKKCTEHQVVTKSYLGIPYTSDHNPIMSVLQF